MESPVCCRRGARAAVRGRAAGTREQKLWVAVGRYGTRAQQGLWPFLPLQQGTAELQTLWGPSLQCTARWGTVWDVLSSGLQGEEVVAAAR